MSVILHILVALLALVAVVPGANAHAIITPALGVNGSATRNDVQRPTTQSPCGNVNIATELPLSTPIIALANGSFIANITNFNGCVHP